VKQLSLKHKSRVGAVMANTNVSYTVKPLTIVPDNSFSRIRRSISMVPEQILFQL
jgi:hypothetical protein